MPAGQTPYSVTLYVHGELVDKVRGFFLRCEAFLYYTFPNFVTSIFIVCNLNLTDGFYSLLLCSFTILQSMS